MISLKQSSEKRLNKGKSDLFYKFQNKKINVISSHRDRERKCFVQLYSN